MKNLNQKFNILSTEEAKNTKGGLRYITTSRTAFESKRNQLQNQRKCMCITHVNGVYCIEW